MKHTHDHGSDQHDHKGHEDHGGHAHGSLGHVHTPANFGRAFAVGVVLNAGFVLVEIIYGLASGSVSLLADAGHNLSDALGLGVAWAAVMLARRKPTRRFTYGLGGTSILAALFNAVFLLLVVGGLTWEAVQRFWEPEPVAGKTVMIVAACVGSRSMAFVLGCSRQVARTISMSAALSFTWPRMPWYRWEW